MMDDNETSGAPLGEIERIYRARLSELWRVAAAVSGSREEAPDLVQEAFIRAVRRMESFRGEGSIEGWLWRIVVNVARDAHRQRLTEVHSELELPGTASSDPPYQGAIIEALSRLSERQRLVVFLRYYADLDYETIATALSISSGTVGATLTTARATLAQALELKEALS
jgi:RNA polymerase sigma factor (sigma-70 family)